MHVNLHDEMGGTNSVMNWGGRWCIVILVILGRQGCLADGNLFDMGWGVHFWQF